MSRIYLNNEDVSGMKFVNEDEVILVNCINIHLADFTEADFSKVQIVGGILNIKQPTITQKIRRDIASRVTSKLPGLFPAHSRHHLVQIEREFASTLPDGPDKDFILSIANITEQKTDLCWEIVDYIYEIYNPDVRLARLFLSIFKDHPLILAEMKPRYQKLWPSLRESDFYGV